MKKLFYFASVAVAATMIGCSDSDKKATEKGFDSFYSQEKCDSLASAMGMRDGAMLHGDFVKYVETIDTTLTVDEAKRLYTEGLQYALKCDTSDMFYFGMRHGMEMLANFKTMYKDLGVMPAPAAYARGFRQILFSDSISQATIDQLNDQVSGMRAELDAMKQQYDSLKLEASEVSTANIERGNEVLGQLKQKGYVMDGSGIAYRVISNGEMPAIKDGDRVNVRYVMKNLDGAILRTSDGAYPTSVDNAGPKGLAFALKKLGKGGQAEVYIPGRLAFGVQGQRFGLGPNEMVVFEVEVLDVNPE